MRFYVSPDSIFPDKNIIDIRDRREIHHIRDVMRLEKGAVVNIFDGKGREFTGVIESISKISVVIEIESEKPLKSDTVFSSTLYQAIPKKDKMELIIEKAVELGVENIVPIVTERTVPDIKDKANKLIERWSKIAMASSKQCGRVNLPAVSGIADFNKALEEAKKSSLVIFAALDKEARPLKSILKGAPHKDISIFIGPEGDFSPQEVKMAKENGFKICSLGQLVLKSDTAGIYVLACLNYELR
ncbi:MAG: RsmE family RNA methyltransferase [Candidatus Omnitrophota bacterium]|nr:RsmE family RNA methyltransferase [Candidatus Omnitrophota bacterium]